MQWIAEGPEWLAKKPNQGRISPRPAPAWAGVVNGGQSWDTPGIPCKQVVWMELITEKSQIKRLKINDLRPMILESTSYGLSLWANSRSRLCRQVNSSTLCRK
jgi:hypothetical protein